MENVEIPTWIWLNAGLLVAAGAIVWFAVGAASGNKSTKNSGLVRHESLRKPLGLSEES